MAKSGENAYENWLSKLSPSARAAFSGKSGKREVHDDERREYDKWRDGLSDKARDWVKKQSPVGEADINDDKVDVSTVRYGCVEAESGEYPVVRLFKNIESMAKHVGKLEGSDVCVTLFRGHLLRISKGPQRYIQAPDGEHVVTVPRDGLGPVHTVEADLVNFDCQEDGFVGPPELAEGFISSLEVEETTQDGHYDDDENNEDDDD